MYRYFNIDWLKIKLPPAFGIAARQTIPIFGRMYYWEGVLGMRGVLKFLAVAFIQGLLLQCSGGDASPPVTLPTPGAANANVIMVTSPDENGSSKVVGEAGAVNASGTVKIYSLDSTSLFQLPTRLISNIAYAQSNLLCSTLADTDGSFSCSFLASIGTLLCITQVDANGQSSDCLQREVPAGIPPYNLTTLIDASIDEASSMTYLLGQDENNQYKLKIFNNQTKAHAATLTLNNLSTSLGTAHLTSVTAYNGEVVITADTEGMLFKITLDSSLTPQGEVATLNVASDQQYGCSLPTYVRFDPELNAGESSPRFLLVCQNSGVENRRFLEFDTQLNAVHRFGQISGSKSFAFGSEYMSLSTSGDHVWYVGAGLTNGNTEIYRLIPNDNNLFTIKTKEVEGRFRSFSSGDKSNGSDVHIGMGVNQTTSLAGTTFLENDDVNLRDIPLTNNVTANDAVCYRRSNCSTGYVLSSSEKSVFSINLSSDTPTVQGTTSIGGLQPARLLVDESSGKVIVVDYKSQAVYWVDSL